LTFSAIIYSFSSLTQAKGNRIMTTFNVSVDVEDTRGPVPQAARFSDYEPVVETHVVQVVAMDADEACDLAIAEVFERYEDQCNLISYECDEVMLLN
jgi:hypothetical protein